MIRISNITSTNFRAVNNYAQPPLKHDKAEEKAHDKNVTDKYLQNLALINSAGVNNVKEVKKVELA